MQENIKDPYHPGLLHTWFVTFGFMACRNRSELKMDKHFRSCRDDFDSWLRW